MDHTKKKEANFRGPCTLQIFGNGNGLPYLSWLPHVPTTVIFVFPLSNNFKIILGSIWTQGKINVGPSKGKILELIKQTLNSPFLS